jgi:hypothetical protein
MAGKAARFARRGYHPNSRHFPAEEVMRQPRPVNPRQARQGSGRPAGVMAPESLPTIVCRPPKVPHG